MTGRIFTVEEANSLIPVLEVHFSKLLQLKPQLEAARGTLETLGEVITAESLLNQTGSKEVRMARGRFRALMDTVSDILNAIGEMGVAVKDLDIGLCDFLGLVDGREVWLCWQYGESSVAYFHELTSGFSGRQPIPTGPGPRTGGDKPKNVRVLH